MYEVLVLLMYLFPFTTGSSGIKLRTAVNFDESQEFPEFIAIVGSSAELLCNVSRPGPDDAVSLVLWYRTDVNAPIYSVDARNGNLMDAKHFSSDILGSRAFFDLRSQPAIMRIDPVEEKDGGKYRCRVDYRWARTLNSAGTLSVIVPPKEISIFNEKGDILRKTIGPFDEGSELKLICEVKGGKPKPSVTWWKNGELIDDDYTETSLGVVHNVLTIFSLKRDDLLSRFSCVANNTNITTPLNTSVTIDLYLKPVDVQITSFKRPLSAGKKVKISCASRGSQPPAQLTWWKDNMPMSNIIQEVSVNQSITVSDLILVPSREDNGMTLTCVSNNPKIPQSTIEDKWKTMVFYKPKVDISLGLNQNSWTVAEDREIHLQCQVDANPSVVRSGWYFNDQILHNNAIQGIIIHNLTLMIQRVQRHHSGRYRCFANNVEGRGESENRAIKVEFSPICRQDQKIAYGVAVNETAYITCEVEADPPDVTFRWSFNSSRLGQELLTHSSEGLKSMASFTAKTKHEYSALYCWGRNRVGMQRKPCVFSVIFIGPPEPLKNCTITNTTIDSIHLECVAGNDGGLQQFFFLEVYNSQLERLSANITSHSKPEFHVSELSEASRFTLLVYSANGKGKSSPVALTAKTKPKPQELAGATPSLLLSPLLGIVIGTVGSLVLVTIIVIVIIRMRGYEEGKGDTPDQKPASSSNELLRDDIPDSREQDSKDPDIIPSQDDWNCLPRRGVDQNCCEILVTSDRCVTSHVGVPEQSTSNTSPTLQKNCGCHSDYENCCIAEFSPGKGESCIHRSPAGYNTTLSTFQRPSGEETVVLDSNSRCNSRGLNMSK
ncbi:nephrin-like isoform X2 [Limulus polyphemus]|uniref:Nephrin-like isoform X2 n=1 Tax=Limulus polyphemus TaxID=6850 RepID=A0ABM1SG57_LIMPO|nr:nephrin-like isoform X2 [Limulus polyphemus]